MKLPVVIALATAVATPLVAAGCGSSDPASQGTQAATTQATTTRAAAGASTCPKVGAYSKSLTVNNYLDRTITMRGRDIDCAY